MLWPPARNGTGGGPFRVGPQIGFAPAAPYLGAAAPSPPHRPERPRPQTPDGLKGFAGRAKSFRRTG
ncbi:hypothetical protein C4B68_17425 [Streptomyces dengpaensis]|uniref:Uncharacterized protein n=1 Tax=Streptomyces dengpaensis TaxID=2049881 RepID=A0ABN5I323_9ACTN|nr:hypothetical protein C4B68_17425 [Streptomyces dengpaensis]